MKRLNTRERQVLTWTLVVGVLMVADHVVWRPFQMRWDELGRSLRREEYRIAYCQSLLQRRREILQQSKGFSGGAAKTRPAGSASVLQEVDTLARRTGMQLLRIAPYGDHGSSVAS